MLGCDGGEGRGAADKGARQEGLDDFILELIALLLVDLAHLLGFDLVDLFLQGVAYDAARQNAFFLACSDQQEVLTDVYQWCVFALAERRDETIGGHLLAGTGAGRFGRQCCLQRFGVERHVLGQAIDKQVFEPHEVNLSFYTKAGIIRSSAAAANPAQSVCKPLEGL